MKLEITTLPFSDDGGGFDQSRLQKLLSGKDVIDYSDHFFFYDGVPYLTMIVSYRDVESGRPFRRKEAYASLSRQEKNVYEKLRQWRAVRAAQEGIPPYLIANNKQLVKRIQLKPDSKEDLRKVGGIGDAKIEKYSEDILKILNESLPQKEDKEKEEKKESKPTENEKKEKHE